MFSTRLLLVQKIKRSKKNLPFLNLNEKKKMKIAKDNLGAFNPFTTKGEFD